MGKSSFIAVVGAIIIVGCAAEETQSASSPSKNAEPSPDATVVPASNESAAKLGVHTWTVDNPRDGQIEIKGYDEHDNVKADLAITVKTSGEESGDITFESTTPSKAKLTYEVRDGVTTETSDGEISDKAKVVFEQVTADIENPNITKPSTSLTKSSFSVSPQGRATGQPLYKGQETCLLDSDGKGCKGNTLLSATACLGIAACTIVGNAAGFLTCTAIGGATCVGTELARQESGCKSRPCSQKAPAK